MNFDRTATVIAINQDTGAESELHSALRCRMVHVSTQPTVTTDMRDELAARRKLFWEPSFNMPEYAQIQLNGDTTKWNTVAGTFARVAGPSRVYRYRRCELVKASDG